MRGRGRSGGVCSVCARWSPRCLCVDVVSTAGTTLRWSFTLLMAGAIGSGCADQEINRHIQRVQTLEGALTWQVKWDDDGLALGREDCSYTRHYMAVEDRSLPWLCPRCERIYRAESHLDGASCHRTISADAASPYHRITGGDTVIR